MSKTKKAFIKKRKPITNEFDSFVRMINVTGYVDLPDGN